MTIPLRSPAPSAPAGQPLPASPLTDADLAARSRGGDGLAFELIMRRYNRRLFRLARSLVRSDAEAEDVLQEAYLRAYTRLGDLADGLVAENEARSDGVLAPDDVNVGAADGGCSNANDRFSGLGPRTRDLLYPDVVDAAKDHRFHRVHGPPLSR